MRRKRDRAAQASDHRPEHEREFYHPGWIPLEDRVEVTEDLVEHFPGGPFPFGREVKKGTIISRHDPIVTRNIEANPLWFRVPARPIERG